MDFPFFGCAATVGLWTRQNGLSWKGHGMVELVGFVNSCRFADPSKFGSPVTGL